MGIERFTDRDIANWSENPPQPDPDAVYAARIVLDLSQVTSARFRTGHGADHGVAGRDRETEDSDPEGLSAFLREFAD